MNTVRRSGPRFFLLVAVLATPLWLLNLVLPDVSGLPKDTPITDFGLAFVPATAALILLRYEDGPGAVRRALLRVFDVNRVTRWRWFVVIACAMPVVYLTSYAGSTALGIPALVPNAPSLLLIPVLVLLFVPLAAGEEVGYMTYLWDAWQRRYGALGACALFSLPWTAGHIPSILQQGKDFEYIAISVFFSFVVRVVWTWVYLNSGRSLFGMIVLHASANVLSSYFIQDNQTPYLAVAAVVVTVLWGPRTLTRYRFRRKTNAVNDQDQNRTSSRASGPELEEPVSRS